MAEIRFLPVCSSCRAILDDHEVDYRLCIEDIERAPKYKAEFSHEIVPNRCPKCGEYFERIVLYTDVPVPPTRRLTI